MLPLLWNINRQQSPLLWISTTCWFPVWTSLSGPPVFVAWIMPVQLLLDNNSELTEWRHKHSLLPRHSTALFHAFLIVCVILKLPPAAAPPSTLSRLRKSFDCTCRAVSSNPDPPTLWTLPPFSFSISDISSLFFSQDFLFLLLLCTLLVFCLLKDFKTE